VELYFNSPIRLDGVIIKYADIFAFTFTVIYSYLFLNSLKMKDTEMQWNKYVGVLISLWLFLFSYLQHNQKNFSWMS
jgi:hypothetical protein